MVRRRWWISPERLKTTAPMTGTMRLVVASSTRRGLDLAGDGDDAAPPTEARNGT
jgi:hypothetical protein